MWLLLYEVQVQPAVRLCVSPTEIGTCTHTYTEDADMATQPETGRVLPVTAFTYDIPGLKVRIDA